MYKNCLEIFQTRKKQKHLSRNEKKKQKKSKIIIYSTCKNEWIKTIGEEKKQS